MSGFRCCTWRHTCTKLSGVAQRTKSKPKPDLVKTEDVEYQLRCASGARAIYREEVWEDRTGRVVRYNLAFIHHEACQQDHGRLVGYDNAHGSHERHFMSETHTVEFISYEQTLEAFQDEVRHYRETT